MMKQILYILLGIMLLSIVSCYDDEGNYDYHDINEVTFGEINTMYNVLLNIDTLKIDVGDFVEMSQGDLTDTDRFEYLWVIFSPSDSHVKDTISTDRVLSYPVTLAPGTYNLYLKIRDNRGTVEKAIYGDCRDSLFPGNFTDGRRCKWECRCTDDFYGGYRYTDS